MRWTDTLGSGAFRFALLVAGMFAIGSLALLAVVDGSVARYAAEATRGSLSAETAALVDDDRAGGRTALLRALQARQSGSDPQFRYALVDRAGRRLAGDLLPGSPRPGFGTIALGSDPDDGEAETIQALTTTLADGAALVVATDSYDIDDLRRGLDRTTLAGGSVVTLLALIGGYFIGGRFLRRLEVVNRAVARIVDGDLDERLPAIGMSREFDTLSHNLNTMLGRIGTLVEAMRQVSTDIAHDLRTPLTRLRNQLETAQAACLPGPEADAIGAALRQTDDMLRIFTPLSIRSVSNAVKPARAMPTSTHDRHQASTRSRGTRQTKPPAPGSGTRTTRSAQPSISCTAWAYGAAGGGAMPRRASAAPAPGPKTPIACVASSATSSTSSATM